MNSSSHVPKISKTIINRILLFILLLLFIVTLSNFTNSFWGNKEEIRLDNKNFVINDRMTVSEYGEINKIPNTVLLNIFKITQLSDTNKSIRNFNNEIILKNTKVEISEYNEDHSKNPIRYTIHFIICVIFMVIVFYMIRKSYITPISKRYLYFISIVIFGIGFNSSPSPMRPVKDTIALVGNISEILHPRLFAILTYLILVVIANKFICSWVCQIGVLQDFIFRLNRNKEDNKGILIQYKLSFKVSNTIRIIFFISTLVISFLWVINIIDYINPFAIYNGISIKIVGWLFVVSILLTSAFIYRPWCYLFCPFGLISWLFERISIFKIRVNYKTCISCNECVKSCPSNTMEAILAKKTIVPDCFACGTCINECPNSSIKFTFKKAKD